MRKMKSQTVEVACVKCGHTADGKWDPRKESKEDFINKGLGPALEQLKGWRRTRKGWLCGCCTGITGEINAKLPNQKDEFLLEGTQHPDGRITDIKIRPTKEPRKRKYK